MRLERRLFVKNIHMNKVDVILLYLFGFLFLSALITSFIHNLVVSFFIAFLVVVLFRTVFVHLLVRRKNKKTISVSELENVFSLMGSEQVDFFLSVVPSPFLPVKKDGGIVFTKSDEKCFLFPNYKFSPTGLDDVAKFFRIAKKENATVVYVLGRYPNRQVLLLGNSFDITFKFIPSRKLHKFLLSQNALPEKPRVYRQRKRVRFLPPLNVIFDKKRARYFALCGLSTVALGFVTPFRLYYFIFGGLSLIFTLICLFKKT